MQVFSFCWLVRVLPFREMNNQFYTVKLKTYNCTVFTDFQHTKLYPFQNLSLGFILKIFLKFREFQPRYSYKIYSYKKECISDVSPKIKLLFSNPFSLWPPVKAAVLRPNPKFLRLIQNRLLSLLIHILI